jgi:cytoskeletal protein RodZ
MSEVNIAVLEEIGAILSTARQEHGLSVEQVCKKVKIKAQFIRAIEEADVSILTHISYTVGYIKIYASFLEINIESLVLNLKTKGGKLPPIASEDLITSENFMPPKWLILLGLAIVVAIYLKYGRS